MYEIAVERSFSAVHRHRAPGRDAALHGHDFRVVVRLAGPDLADDVLVDFHDLEVALAALLADLGHRDLSSHPAFAGREATPAAIARHVYDTLASLLALPAGVRLDSVEVRDTDATGARFAP